MVHLLCVKLQKIINEFIFNTDAPVVSILTHLKTDKKQEEKNNMPDLL